MTLNTENIKKIIDPKKNYNVKKEINFEYEPSDELIQAIEESKNDRIVCFKNSEELIKIIRK